MVETPAMADKQVYGQQQQPSAHNMPLSNVFNKVAKPMKKVVWPPHPEPPPKEVSPPPDHVELLEEIPMNDEAMFQNNDSYKLAPTVYAEDPDNFNEDVWPPPVPPNLNERVVYDSSRPQRVIRDFEVAVPAEAHVVHKSYKIAPGTLHVFADRGVLSYNTPDIGAASMQKPEKN